jgi:ornithine cyclodeaminase/alanine dehydrogenase-like protein (mu-crystallin family)
MTDRDAQPIRWLNATDIAAAMPPLAERLDLAERTMVALVGDADLPPKVPVHPRPAGSFAHAMPAHLRDREPGGAGDLLGIKWIAGFPENRAVGLPALHGLVLLNDPATGVPLAVLDAGPITAERTAAVSGVAMRLFAPPPSDRSPRVAILGAGVQARSHLPVIGAVLPGADVEVFDRHPDRAAALAEEASRTDGIGDARAAASARHAVSGADVVVTVASFAPPAERQALTSDWLGLDALVVAVDYATYVAASVAREAVLFVVDERAQFLANRDAGNFDGYPDPPLTIGEAILARTPRPASGRILVTHLGVGLADLVFGDAILRRAVELDLGTTLAR